MSRTFLLPCQRCGEDVPRKRRPQAGERVEHNAEHRNSKGENCKRLVESEGERKRREEQKTVDCLEGIIDWLPGGDEARHLSREELREEARLEPIRSALELLGAAERNWQEGKKLTGEPRACQCNGHHILQYDEDGSPSCAKCGGARPDASHNPEAVIRLRNWETNWETTESLQNPKTLRHEDGSLVAPTKSDRPKGWNDITVKRPGEPVEVVSANQFEKAREKK